MLLCATLLVDDVGEDGRLVILDLGKGRELSVLDDSTSDQLFGTSYSEKTSDGGVEDFGPKLYRVRF